MKVLIDNGHGNNTPGKCSPDQSYREYRWTRDIAQAVVDKLRRRGVDAELLVPELGDVSLVERVHRANTACTKHGALGVCLVSIHSNAAGNGEWMQGRGWSAYTSPGQTKSDVLATCLYEEAKKNFKNQRLRTDISDGDADLEANFYILTKTRCAAVLTENFFHDNKEDLAYMTSKEGMAAVVITHVDGIMAFINSLKK